MVVCVDYATLRHAAALMPRYSATLPSCRCVSSRRVVTASGTPPHAVGSLGVPSPAPVLAGASSESESVSVSESLVLYELLPLSSLLLLPLLL